MIIKQKFVYREDLQANPQVFYVFGDNSQRVGMGGQAKEMREEPNAIGIATKKSPSEFFADCQEDFLALKKDLDFLEFEIVNTGCDVVFPLDGIGTGLSEMETRCPKLWKYMNERLERIFYVADCLAGEEDYYKEVEDPDFQLDFLDKLFSEENKEKDNND
jgi:hypothetical protein